MFRYSLLIFVILIIVSIFVFYRRRQPRILIDYKKEPDPIMVARVIRLKVEWDRIPAAALALDSEWRQKMEIYSRRMQAVKSICLIHGTFVGTDPLHIIEFLHRSYPSLPLQMIRKAQHGFKAGTDKVVGDLGNFSPEYVGLMRQVLKRDVYAFKWASGNHHIARFLGTIKLIKHIAYSQEHLQLRGSDRMLLIGHSHAGQLFALLGLMLEPPWDTILQRLALKLEPEIDIWKLLRTIQAMNLDFVTLGTPKLYPFSDTMAERLLHIINHRGVDTRGGSVSGILHTRDGDAIQQWGVLGSDWGLPVHKQLKEINADLDRLLGKGVDYVMWLERIKTRNRLHEKGQTILADYQDQSTFLPNFYQTMFGHGSYTRVATMRSLIQMICDHLYN